MTDEVRAGTVRDVSSSCYSCFVSSCDALNLFSFLDEIASGYPDQFPYVSVYVVHYGRENHNRVIHGVGIADDHIVKVGRDRSFNEVYE